jgi:hypothetical protein
MVTLGAARYPRNLIGGLGGLVRAALFDLDVLDTEVLKALIVAQHNDKWTMHVASRTNAKPLNTRMETDPIRKMG